MEAKTINQRKNVNSLLKKVFLSGGETANAMKLSYILGLGLGATGRFTKQELIPAIPPIIDLVGGAIPTPSRVACYTAYAAGIATAYADKIYTIIADLTDKLN